MELSLQGVPWSRTYWHWQYAYWILSSTLTVFAMDMAHWVSLSICRTAYGTTFGVPFINTHTKLHKALKMSAKQAAKMCTPEEVPEDVHFELLFDDEIDWDEWGGKCEPFRHDCINNLWPLSWFFNIGIIAIVSVCSRNKYDLYMIWFCGRNMKYMSSSQPKRSVKRILATFPGSLQCRMSTNRPWPSSPRPPIWQPRTVFTEPLTAAPAAGAAYTSSPVSSSAPGDPFPETAATTRVDDEHVLREFVNSNQIKTLTKKLSKMWRGSGNGWPRSHIVRGGISLTLNLLTWTVMWVFFCWSWKSPTTQTMSQTHWQVSIGQLTVNWRRSAMVIVWLILKSLSWARKY